MIDINRSFAFPQVLDCCPGAQCPLTDLPWGQVAEEVWLLAVGQAS